MLTGRQYKLLKMTCTRSQIIELHDGQPHSAELTLPSVYIYAKRFTMGFSLAYPRS